MVPSSHSWKRPQQAAYTMNESMEALRISRATIYELINAGKLRTYMIGRRRYCTHEAILECQHLLEAEAADLPPAA